MAKFYVEVTLWYFTDPVTEHVGFFNKIKKAYIWRDKIKLVKKDRGVRIETRVLKEGDEEVPRMPFSADSDPDKVITDLIDSEVRYFRSELTSRKREEE